MQPIPEVELPLACAVRERKDIHNEIFGIERDGDLRWVSASVRYIEGLGLFASILADITDVVKARSALAAAIDGLESRVKERTQALTEVNAELEAFSYSLSHDMKAPLTRIEGWANVLQQDYRNLLGEDGLKSLLFLKGEVAGMHEMIRAMLSLAKASTADLAVTKLDASAIVAEVLQLLRDHFTEVEVDLQIEPNLYAYADRTLFTLLIRNLLDNAIKFSSHKKRADVAVGVVTNAGVPAYYVRDAGDGFDMSFAHRLFGPFQRMHTQKEFPGTGIGLATAQRIVHRHGGKIWVESVKGAGTTFFFTLPQMQKNAVESNS